MTKKISAADLSKYVAFSTLYDNLPDLISVEAYETLYPQKVEDYRSQRGATRFIKSLVKAYNAANPSAPLPSGKIKGKKDGTSKWSLQARHQILLAKWIDQNFKTLITQETFSVASEFDDFLITE